ncbi:c-type cytochrome [Motiliproteus sp. MSK22-1]|uniref:c-type cytochrome n=1 Tax=Motiliproteus sp. MSK22-1 TaxID=1897630 RepID=UPI0009758560|nr:c-type cytochrome [Motiliproteus sp. MSK22-1]OMH29043.1 hypothetical protein BGP75_20000 [Motiliproteus sp. MSK22-1]
MKKHIAPALALAFVTITTIPAAVAETGEQIFGMLCSACHKVPDNDAANSLSEHAGMEESMLPIETGQTTYNAPPIVEVKKRYLREYPQREQFVAHIKAWVLSPAADKALLPEILRHSALMPELGLAEDQAEKVAEFIYQADF